jgi:bifunctional DNA-binding transcriptional regulator/antitoxin component of YhaV-PrlF toxin-antitoxin module
MLWGMATERKAAHAAGSGTFVALQRRGTIAIPADIRKRHHLDEPGAQVELVERADGVIEMRPQLPHPADQQWFWSERWQRMEREADADIAAGRVVTHDSDVDFLAHLDRLGADS